MEIMNSEKEMSVAIKNLGVITIDSVDTFSPIQRLRNEVGKS